MSPPSQAGPASKGTHSRKPSANLAPKAETKTPKRQPPPEPEVHYTVLIRLPFARGDFVDPPLVEWDAAKDKQLWKIISRSPKTGDLDWQELANKFQVSPTFILQQAAWLYERHLSHVKAQMKKVGALNATPSLGSERVATPAGGVPMHRLGSGGRGSCAPSALSIRPKESPLLKGEASVPGTPRPVSTLSRTPSTNTITQSRLLPSSFRHPPIRRRPTPPTGASSPASTSSSSSTSSETKETNLTHRSQIFRRAPRHKAKPHPALSTLSSGPETAAEEDSESSSHSLPFARVAAGGPDPGATTTLPKQGRAEGKKPAVDSSASSLASASVSASGQGQRGERERKPGPLSPRRRAELARLSPRGKRREGSEGSPSMGSSFSDLDDTSVTQSALEEALLSNMQHGGLSRISTLSQAIRSKYL
ncbi:hypothetical protein M501DRAFT_954368 [Patellaria atrata CBS 101060]|uniref:Autophagy-related protein 29 n=1 Tax=Patellaria atrata CBS 101060 TaxID=1346257 RepID=A0A9P4SB41_9PEZI|nr:hypothetical protein M501DRAFT_954368 [Patellaria atrata CBS 101060]